MCLPVPKFFSSDMIFIQNFKDKADYDHLFYNDMLLDKNAKHSNRELPANKSEWGIVNFFTCKKEGNSYTTLQGNRIKVFPLTFYDGIGAGKI
jgi:hypothetical protein